MMHGREKSDLAIVATKPANRLRRHRIGGLVLYTPGVLALWLQGLLLVDEAISGFDEFHPDNDPHGEHDFGTVRIAGHTVMFKIDYYDANRSGHSPDPADPTVTCQIMTIMLAEEY